MLQHIFCIITFLVILLQLVYGESQSYYDLLGVGRDADTKEIRKAFKAKALILHPDKNVNEPNAHENFIKVNRAYEILKDDELRKKYDLHGEKGLEENGKNGWKGKGQGYKSWNYYSESFGIYDDDPEIVTLSRSDFEQSVKNSPFIWFVNYYSPQCPACHRLSPNWRQLAREFEDVVRVGAVNCEEDWQLCREEEIQSYPSLLLYPDKEKYKGKRDTESMAAYILQLLNDEIILINDSNYKTLDTGYWLLMNCYGSECIFDDVKKKIANVLKGLINVGEIFCNEDSKLTCKEFEIISTEIRFYIDIQQPRNYFQITDFKDAKEVVRSVFQKIPSVKASNGKDFKEMIKRFDDDSRSEPIVVVFSKSSKKEDDALIREMKRLPALLYGIEIMKINCEKEKKICERYDVKTFPKFMFIRKGGLYEFYQGRISSYDISTFARASFSSRLSVLNPETFKEKVVAKSSAPYLVDFYAPWCPPCMKLMPELRKASIIADTTVNFGSIDCTVYSNFCNMYNIKSYPTLIFYNSSIPHQFDGSYVASSVVDFIQETLNPTVVNLDSLKFEKLVLGRLPEEMWLLDFYAPWCGPCKTLAPEWRQLAKILKAEKRIHVGNIDCTKEQSFCQSQGIKSYPTIRLYPSTTNAKNVDFHVFSTHNRNANSIRIWTYQFLISEVKEIQSEDEFNRIIASEDSWLIDYYTQWCSHCQTFSPEFELVAKNIKEFNVKSGKVDCQNLQNICVRAGIKAYPQVNLYLRSSYGNPKDDVGIRISNFEHEYITSYVQEQIKAIKKDLIDR